MTCLPVAPSRLPVGSSASIRLGPADEGAGDGHALLLAARKLRRIVADAMAEPDRLERRLGQRRTHRERPANSSGRATFSCAVIVGMRWNAWKTMPIWSRRSRARSSSPSGPRSLPATSTRPDVARSSPPADHHQARLAGTRRPHHRRNLAGRDVESDAAQDIDRAGIARHVEMHVGQANDRNCAMGSGSAKRAPGTGGRMKLQSRYGGFTAAVNSRIAASWR